MLYFLAKVLISALLIAAIALLRDIDAPEWMTPLLCPVWWAASS